MPATSSRRSPVVLRGPGPRGRPTSSGCRESRRRRRNSASPLRFNTRAFPRSNQSACPTVWLPTCLLQRIACRGIVIFCQPLPVPERLMQTDLPISATSVRMLIQLGLEHGLSVTDCLDGTGVDANVMRDPTAQVTAGQEFEVIRNLQRRLGAAQPGLAIEAGSRYHVAMHGAWGLAVVTSRTVRDAVDIGVRYGELGWVYVKFSFAEVRGEAVLGINAEHIPDDVRAFLVERNSAATQAFILDALGTGIPFTAVRFRHP